MPDLLTHVLVGYSLGTILTVFDDRFRSPHVTLVMVGAITPDLVKVRLLVSSRTVEALLGIPFDWSPLHTIGGTVIVVGLGVLLVAPEQRRRAIVLLTLGAASHHALDLLLITPSGYAYPVLWPFTAYRPPAGNLYLSSDRWPAAVAGIFALSVWVWTEQRD